MSSLLTSNPISLFLSATQRPFRASYFWSVDVYPDASEAPANAEEKKQVVIQVRGSRYCIHRLGLHPETSFWFGFNGAVFLEKTEMLGTQVKHDASSCETACYVKLNLLNKINK